MYENRGPEGVAARTNDRGATRYSSSRVAVVGTGTWAVEHAWKAPFAADMAITSTEHVILAHQDRYVGEAMGGRWLGCWLGAYSRRGELVRRWAVECTPTRPWTARWLRYDPRTGQLALFLEVSTGAASADTADTAVYVYA
jgi:hypothetical protein